MVVKVYVSGISGNKEVKKRQQRVLMILDSKSVKYEVTDIAEPGKDGEKEFMQNHCKANGATVSDPNPRHPLPPQIFNDEEYCGDYDQFDMANEIDTLEQFLKIEVPKSEEESNTKPNGEATIEEKNESSAESEEKKDETNEEPAKTDETVAKTDNDVVTNEPEKSDAKNEDEVVAESKTVEDEVVAESKTVEDDGDVESKINESAETEKGDADKTENVEASKTNEDEGGEESKAEESKVVEEVVSRVSSSQESSSRESSKEKEVKTNGVEEGTVDKEVAAPQTVEPETKKDLTPSEVLIESEKQPA